MKRLEVGLNLAGHLGSSHAILTGKADPTQEDPHYLIRLVEACRRHLPLVDMHTNGLLLQAGKKHVDLLGDLADAGLTMVTFSIAHTDYRKNREIMGIAQDPEYLVKMARNRGLLVRCSLVLCKEGVSNALEVLDYVTEVAKWGAQMVVVREIWTPGGAIGWNAENKIDLKGVEDSFRGGPIYKGAYTIQERDPLPWGQRVYAVGSKIEPDFGVNVTFARCDDASKDGFLKSIVHKVDGHGYRNWDHQGDILY
jgi:hypothetical protein